jgi:NAD+ kinase
MTPIRAHVLAAKSFVLAPERRVSVEVGHIKANPAYLSVDGGASLSIMGGDVIRVRKSDKYTLLVHLSDRSFYKKVSEKLGEKF